MNDRNRNAATVFLVALTGLALYVLYLTLKPFLATLVLAAVLAVLTSPLHGRLTVALKGRRVAAAVLTCFGVTVAVLIPFSVIIGLVTVESIDLYGRVSAFVQEGGVPTILSHPLVATVRSWLERYMSLFGIDAVTLKARLAAQLQSLSGHLLATGQKAAANVLGAVGLFFILILTLFFFLLDGRKMVAALTAASPLPDADTARILRRFEDVTQASFVGMFGVAAAQGALGGVALAIVGFQGFLWGFLMALLSFLPMAGAALVWAPAGVLLLVTGRPVAGLFILAWGVAVISTVDNFLRPWLMKGKSGLHPLALLLSILGGVRLFGMVGIVLGPLVAGVALTFLEMFREQFGAERKTTSG